MPLRAIRSVLELLAPQRCLSCRRRSAGAWCARCDAVTRPLPEGCPRCAGPQGAPHRCWPPHAPVAGTVAAFDYRGVVARAVVTAKLTGAHAGWRDLGRVLAERVARDPPDVDVVSWVTTPAARRRRRGVDHARVLAAAVATRLDVPLLRLLDVQVERDGRDSYRAPAPLPGTNVLLVDDVLTTGATAVRATTALVEAGAGSVRLAVVARAGTHELYGAEVVRSTAREGHAW